MLGFGNIYYYFLFLFIVCVLTLLTTIFLKNRSKKFIYYFIFYLLLSGFILHFLKLFFEPYDRHWPNSLKTVSFENICAVNTLLFPWLYLIKNKWIKDYLVVIGLFSGLGAMLVPFQSAGFETITFDIIRFYYAHFILFLAPFLMLITKQYKFKLKSILKVPLALYFVFGLILVNEILLISLGVIEGDFNTLLDPNIRNHALIFGPSKFVVDYDWLYKPFVPAFFTKIPMGPNAGETLYWPFIWILIPAYLYVCLGGVFIELVFNKLLNKKLHIFDYLSQDYRSLDHMSIRNAS